MAAEKIALLIFAVVFNIFEFSVADTDPPCGTVDHLVGYVINAEETENVWPWHVAIYNSSNAYIAGGTIVSDRFILTAAHVTFHQQNTKVRPYDLHVVMGIKDLTRPQNYTRYGNVSRIYRYDKYDVNTKLNDLALLQLTKKIEFSSYIRPICLWPVGGPSLETLAENQRGTVVGWGFTENSTISQVLRQAEMSIIDFPTCAENTKSFQPLLAKGKNYCAGTRGEATVCRGDSGGGMYFMIDYRWYIRGIVNQGTPTQDTRYPCDPHKEVIFMDVTYYQKWVERLALPKQHNLLGLSECGMGKYEGDVERDVIKSPWIAHLYYRFWDRFNVSDCHGLLVHPEFVVTLARCLIDQPQRKLLHVVLGDETIGPDPYEESVDFVLNAEYTELFIHEKFREDSFGYDIGLVHLKKPIESSNPFIKPICLPSAREPVPYYEQLAWYRRADHPKQLAFSHLQEIRLDSCIARYNASGVSASFDQLMCLQDCLFSGDVHANGTYTCQVMLEKVYCDIPLSGGPVYYTKHDGYDTYTYVAGMRSFGTNNCTDRLNDVYADLVEMGPWIERKIMENMLFIEKS